MSNWYHRLRTIRRMATQDDIDSFNHQLEITGQKNNVALHNRLTGLSLAASFIPGGLVVKAVIGAGIGAMQAISEGKDWKAVLASAAGGAITGAIPFLKMGPLAKLGVGAMQGGITALASGGSLKDALKGAAGGAIDAFDPGAFHALPVLGHAMYVPEIRTNGAEVRIKVVD